MTGKLTTKRYKYATVFGDQASKLGYDYLQKTATVEETLEANKSFQQYSWDRGVKILAYHADNGIFRANESQQACQCSTRPLYLRGSVYTTQMTLLKHAYEIYKISHAQNLYMRPQNGMELSQQTYGHMPCV